MNYDIITVPDLHATKLTALVARELDLTHLDQGYTIWDYYVGSSGKLIPGRGCKFKPMVWTPDLRPGEVIPADVVRDHFRKKGALGHVGAFTWWCRVFDPRGYHISVPDIDACWYHDSRSLSVPGFMSDQFGRDLARHWPADSWHYDVSFVGFLPVP
ncbi:hypothetical protein HYW18_01850 [Candidatus Uhrbacteria bacterium]|nr:hypothetical protein [Candidatus Uhrbacteria bacterium]